MLVRAFDLPGLEGRRTFRVTVRGVNAPPQLEAIPAQTMVLGEGSKTIPVSFQDIDSAVAVRLRAWRSRQNVPPDSTLRMQAGIVTPPLGVWYLTITAGPEAGVGSTAITVEARDGLLYETTSFTLTVHGPDFVPLPEAVASPDLNFEPR